MSEEAYAVIPLTKGKEAIIDVTSLHLVDGNRWRTLRGVNTWYAGRASRSEAGKYKHVFMHRVVLRTPPGVLTDHINGNGLDNRRCNLRPCSHAQNMSYRVERLNPESSYRGVRPFRRGKLAKPWQARLGKFHLGYYSNPEDAAIAFDLAAIRFYGPFAKTNVIENGPENYPTSS